MSMHLGTSAVFFTVRQKISAPFFVSRAPKKGVPTSDRHKSQITKFAVVIHKHK